MREGQLKREGPALRRGPMVPVWSVPVRLLHWGLATTVLICWFIGEANIGLHIAAGYVALALASIRTVWGFIGDRHARFSAFVRSRRIVLGYARDLIGHRERHYLGHNPLGGWMICLLLALTIATCVSGWLYTLDAFWGYAWVEWLHRGTAWTLATLVVGHLAGVAHTSWRYRENLVAAMVTGRKRDDG